MGQAPPARGAAAPNPHSAAQSGMPWPGGKNKKSGGKPLQPPGISGTVASLVISPDFFADKNGGKSSRPKQWWSPGKKPLKLSKINLMFQHITLFVNVHIYQWFLIFFDRLPFLDILRYEITLK